MQLHVSSRAHASDISSRVVLLGAYHLRANPPGVCEGGRQKEESTQIMVVAIEQNTCEACYVAQCIALCAYTTFEWPEASYIMLYGNEVRQNTLTCGLAQGQRRRI